MHFHTKCLWHDTFWSTINAANAHAAIDSKNAFLYELSEILNSYIDFDSHFGAIFGPTCMYCKMLRQAGTVPPAVTNDVKKQRETREKISVWLSSFCNRAYYVQGGGLTPALLIRVKWIYGQNSVQFFFYTHDSMLESHFTLLWFHTANDINSLK